MDLYALLKLVSKKRASDLFITVGMPPCIKLNGRIMPVSEDRVEEQQAREMVIGVMSPAQQEEFAQTKEETAEADRLAPGALARPVSNRECLYHRPVLSYLN